MSLGNINNYLFEKTYDRNFSIRINEKYDIERLITIIENFENLKSQIFSKDKSHDEILTILNNMRVNKEKNIPIIYKFTKNKKEGRLYGPHSLQGVSKVIRHTLIHDLYLDIDIKNCHVKILEWYCNRLCINCEHISYYVKNREVCVEELNRLGIDGKTICLTIINGDNPLIDKDVVVPEWLMKYIENMEEILNKVYDINPKIVKNIEKTKGNFNIRGKVINSIYCKIENNLLLLMKEYCDMNSVYISSLVFDGMTIENSEKTKDELFLRNMENFILQKADFGLDLIEKPMKNGLDIEKYIKEKKEKNKEPPFDIDSFILQTVKVSECINMDNFSDWNKCVDKSINPYDLVELFKRTIFEIQNSCKTPNFCIKDIKLENVGCSKIKRAVLTQNVSLKSLSLWLKLKHTFILNTPENLKCLAYQSDIKPEASKKNIIKIQIYDIFHKLLSSNGLQVYNGYKFEPYLFGEPIEDNYYNLFEKFELTEDNIFFEEHTNTFKDSLMYNHVNILCNGNESMLNYVLDFIADMFQNPARVPGKLITFISEQGVGKNIFSNFLRMMIGSQYFAIFDNPDNLFNDFNAEQNGLLLTVLNELSDSGTMFSKHNKLKGIITRETVRIEFKGKDAIVIPHYSRYLAFTQFENTLNIEPSDRRNIMIKCNSEFANKKEYFEPLLGWMDNLDNIKSAFSFFVYRDISNFNIMYTPETDIKNNQKINSMPNSLQFIRYIFEDKDNMETIKIQTSDLFKQYVDYCSEQKLKNVKRLTFLKQLELINLHQIERFYYTQSEISALDKTLKFFVNKKSRTQGFILDKISINAGFKVYLKLNYDLVEFYDDINEEIQSDYENEYKNERVNTNTTPSDLM